jgi:hypothetical protein
MKTPDKGDLKQKVNILASAFRRNKGWSVTRTTETSDGLMVCFAYDGDDHPDFRAEEVVQVTFCHDPKENFFAFRPGIKEEMKLVVGCFYDRASTKFPEERRMLTIVDFQDPEEEAIAV